MKSPCDIYLAPMEGVVDSILRDLLTRIGGIDRCVTEFVRVSDQCLPNRVFYRLCPELRQQGLTAAGVPVFIQLLGNNPELMAANAARAVKLGAKGIDLNFGCPAKTVNKNRGGSILLKEPDVLYQIVTAVSNAVGQQVPVTAKMRLGYDDKSLAFDNAQALVSAGATEICVHARTKVEGYRPPAHWDWIPKIAEQVSVPVIANGDVFGLEEIDRCLDVTGCSRIMIGRGLLRTPDLAKRYKTGAEPLTWSEIQQLLYHYVLQVEEQMLPKHAPGRVKQWLAYLKICYPEAVGLFQDIKGYMDLPAIRDHIARQCENVSSEPC